MSRNVHYYTQVPSISVICTNTVGIHHLQGQWFVFEFDDDERQVLEHYGPFASFELADDRAIQCVNELNIIASALPPDSRV